MLSTVPTTFLSEKLILPFGGTGYSDKRVGKNMEWARGRGRANESSNQVIG